VRAARSAARANLSPPWGRAYNIGGGSRVSINAIVRLLETMTKKSARIKRLPAQAGDVQHTYADTTAAQAELGYRPEYGLDVGLLLDKLDECYVVVSGWRRDRKDPWLSRRLPSLIANALSSRVTGVVLKDYGCTLKAYRREVIEDVKLYGEMHLFIPALVSWSGAKVTEVPVRHERRRFGKSKYGISRTLRVLLDLITVKFLGSYSTKPLYVFGMAGLIFWLLAVLSGV